MRRFFQVVAAMILLGACSRDEAPQPPVIDVAAGQQLAAAHCASCHGLDGRGEESGIPNLAAQPADYLVSSFHAYEEGVRHHAGLGDMTRGIGDADIRNIAAYYAGLSPLEPVASAAPAGVESSSYDEGGRIAAICEECHGEKGFSTEAGVPSLAGQQPAYLIAATRDYLTGGRVHAGRESMLEGLRHLDIEKMAMYFASQLPPPRPAPPYGEPGNGESLSENCVDCHGERGVSDDPLVPTLAGQEPGYLVSALKAYRDHQRSHEDMLTDLDDSQMEDVAAYYATMRLETPAGGSPDVSNLVAKCERCHGPAVGDRTLVVPSLRGQDRDYLVRVMKAYRDDDRGSSMMHKMSASYTDETLEALAAYYAGHSPD